MAAAQGKGALIGQMRRINKRFLHFLLICLVFMATCFVCGGEAQAESYMSDKTEIPVNLEVSGAEALCQTEDGYVWIAQYSGLTRYDSKEFVTYKSFEYDGAAYNIINVTGLAARGNDLFVATSDHVFVYKDYHFEPLMTVDGVITDIVLDEAAGRLYVCTRGNGGIVFDIAAGTETTIPGQMVWPFRISPRGRKRAAITTSRTTAFTIRTGMRSC